MCADVARHCAENGLQVSEVPAVLENARVHVSVGCGLPASNNYRQTRAIRLQGTSSMEWLENRSATIKYQMDWPRIKKSNVYVESQV